MGLQDAARAQKPRGDGGNEILYVQRSSSMHNPDHLGFAHRRGNDGCGEKQGVHVNQDVLFAGD
jgi:hypothetical protein